MTENSFKIGQGKISGYVSIFLASLSFLAVFCFKYPRILTSPEFRAIYTGEDMALLLSLVIIASLFFAVLSFILSKKKSYSLIGLLIIIATVLMGGFKVEPSVVGESKWYLGLDWLLLDLLLMAMIFIPIEMVWPKRLGQDRFHEEWKTDLVYFVISHLFIQFFGIAVQAPAKAVFGGIGFSSLQIWVQKIPFLLQLFFAFFVTDFCQYWTHRFFHSRAFLWRFHSIHHSTQNMDWLAGRQNPLY